MKHIWIKKDNTKSLIVFFCGWGMDKNVIEHLGSQSDLVMFYDYRNLDCDTDAASILPMAFPAP